MTGLGYPVDLHTHSLRSDGAYEPAELVRRAAARGVRLLALSDHDTLLGAAEASAEGERQGVRVVPATELNTESEWGDVHVLGYLLDPSDTALAERLSRLREHRAHRIELMIERLTDLGYPVALERVLAIAKGGALGRPHLAQALFEAGHVRSFDDAFLTLIGKGSPAYVPRVGLTPLGAVALVREHGGAPALAHPRTVRDLDARLPELVEGGLAGMECYYSSRDPRIDHTPAVTSHLLALAAQHDLVVTGGSDFHGRGEHGAPLGGVWVPPDAVDALEARRERARERATARVSPYHVEPVEGKR
jgi:hypothetical protein